MLATPEFQWPYHDTIRQVSHSRTYDGFTVGPGWNYSLGKFKLDHIGQVVAVVRIGGRHMRWSDMWEAVADRGEAGNYATGEYDAAAGSSSWESAAE